jgi:hypothetical protein
MNQPRPARFEVRRPGLIKEVVAADYPSPLPTGQPDRARPPKDPGRAERAGGCGRR